MNVLMRVKVRGCVTDERLEHRELRGHLAPDRRGVIERDDPIECGPHPVVKPPLAQIEV
jgi:hypothetical protein